MTKMDIKSHMIQAKNFNKHLFINLQFMLVKILNVISSWLQEIHKHFIQYYTKLGPQLSSQSPSLNQKLKSKFKSEVLSL